MNKSKRYAFLIGFTTKFYCFLANPSVNKFILKTKVPGRKNRWYEGLYKANKKDFNPVMDFFKKMYKI